MTSPGWMHHPKAEQRLREMHLPPELRFVNPKMRDLRDAVAAWKELDDAGRQVSPHMDAKAAIEAIRQRSNSRGAIGQIIKALEAELTEEQVTAARAAGDELFRFSRK